MKLLDILTKELKEWPDGMFYAVQDYDNEVKFGSKSSECHALMMVVYGFEVTMIMRLL